MQWFRWYHGTCADPKLGSIARKVGTTRERVIAVWAMLLESASEAEARGEFTIDADGIADCLNCDTDAIRAVLGEMTQRSMITGRKVVAFETRNPPRDDSSPRVKRHREKKRNAPVTVTPPDVTPLEIEIDVDTETTPSIHLSSHAKSQDEERHVSLVIRLANRGMSENPAIDSERFRPILPQHGESRQVVAEWRAAGIAWPTIEATVYDRASKYKPSDRYRQIDRLTYFSSAVLEAHERLAALDVTPPAIPTETQAVHGFGELSGGPEVQEWAIRLDGLLRAALLTDAAVKLEVDQVRANLRRLNEQDRDFKNLRAPDQEAFLWIRVLNWYGEKVGDPRPGRRLSAA